MSDAPTLEQMADAVDLEARRPESAMRVLDRTGDMYAEQAVRAATLRSAAETLRGMAWRPIEDAPKTGRVSLVVQSPCGLEQYVVTNCLYESDDLGGAYWQAGDSKPFHLAENCQFATHWSQPIEMPPPTPPEGEEG